MAPKKASKPAAPKKKAGGVEKKVQKKRAKKDKNAPKRGKSPYIFYVTDARKSLIEKDPSLAKDIAKTGSMLGASWGKLSAAQKQPYEKLAQQDKIRYEREKAAYAKKH
eukprot:GHVQ01025046.1.p4 GENE.GHVQ01025046.1~~GHVQ01025046.1.p4  ORF type:complete len:109 (-),score=18.88 GHVQ01025046.1:1287-1613(-)